MTKNGNGLGAGLFVTGAVIGAAFAMLTTPFSGQRLRRKVRHRFEDEADRIGHLAREVKDQCNHLYARSERMVRKLGE